MADVFVSYARSDKTLVAPLVAAIQAQGWSVWWDPEIDAGQQFDDQIEAELKAAKAVLVVWTPTSAASRWVRGEAREAADRGKEWIRRALLIDPDNMNMRYNFACGLSTYARDFDGAMDLLGPLSKRMSIGLLNHAKADPDLDPLREDPRFIAMIDAAEARLAAGEGTS